MDASLCQLRFKVKVKDQVQLAGTYSDKLGKKPRLSALLGQGGWAGEPGPGAGSLVLARPGTPALPPQIRPRPCPGCQGVLG